MLGIGLGLNKIIKLIKKLLPFYIMGEVGNNIVDNAGNKIIGYSRKY